MKKKLLILFFVLCSTKISAEAIFLINIRTIRIGIISLWWDTWRAYVLYVAALAGLILLLIRSQLKQLKEKHELELQQRESANIKKMDEMKSRFFSNITHEFRTPLSLIISPLEQVLQDKELTPELSKKLSIVDRNAQHLLRLINQLLDMSKLESGNMKLALCRGELNSFVEEIVESFSQTAETRHIKLTADTTKAEGTYLFDTEKWEKILFNLVSNALKFTPENGEVKVKLFASEKDKDNSLMHLQVSDTGIGIPEAKIPFIFHRFYQADETGTRKYEGTGIGLSLLKELIELMGGEIEAESKPGEGTVFMVSVPVKRATENIDAESEQPLIVHEQETGPVIIKALKASGPRNDNLPLILVVEDNAELCEFISRSLGKTYRILTAANGAEGLKIAIEENPDVIVSDVVMPEMDGYALCKKIKSNVQTDHIAVILLTAKASHHSVMEGLIAGADGYLTKPFHTDELLLRIHNLLLWQEKIRLLFQAQLGNPEIEMEPKKIQHEFITNLYKILGEHLDDNTLNVAKLSSLMAVSHRTLNRKLTSLIGLSANEVIRQYRLKKSIEFLKAGANVSETAYSVGFETHSHFSTSFKSFFGVTPSSYMQTKGDK